MAVNTCDPALHSWVKSAEAAGTDFPIQNLPFGVFSGIGRPGIGVAIGDQILDLQACAGLLPASVREACAASALNPLMALGNACWSHLRTRLSQLLNR